MKKIIALLFCLLGSSSLFAQENTLLGTGALSQATTLKYAIKEITVTNPDGYSVPTVTGLPNDAVWDYSYMDLSYNEVWGEAGFRTTSAPGTFSLELIGGSGSGATISIWSYYQDGPYHYYEISYQGGIGYAPQVTLSSSTGNLFNLNAYVNQQGFLNIYYYDYYKTNLYTTAPTVSISFGGATATAVLEDAAANGRNTAIGYQALYNSTMSNNVALGNKSGYELTTGKNNTFIGTYAGKGITTGSGNTIIGGSNTSLSNSLSNSIVLADGNGSNRMYFTPSGNALIGYGNTFTDNGYKLDVNGNGRFVGTLLIQSTPQAQISFANAAGTGLGYFTMSSNPNGGGRAQIGVANTANSTQGAIYFDQTGTRIFGNLGVGTLSTGEERLDVAGNIKLSGDFRRGSNIYTLPSASGTLALASEIPTSSQLSLQGITDIGAITTNTIQANAVGQNLKLGGVANSGGLFQSPVGDNLIYLSNWTDNAKSLTLNPVNGNVAIGGDFKIHPNKAVLFNYGSLSETANGASTILGNNVVSGLGSNMIKKLHVADNGSFVSLNYQNGITFHTGINSPYNVEVSMFDHEKMRIEQNGNVGIGTTNQPEKLAVKGKIKAQEIKVQPTGWADYVFEEGYQPLSLAEISAFVKQHKHLPEVPSAKEVAQNGLELGEMNKMLLKKIEELTLHLIEKDKQLEQQGSQISSLQLQFVELKKLLETSTNNLKEKK